MRDLGGNPQPLRGKAGKIRLLTRPLDLPDIKDNLEARLILLRRRLEGRWVQSLIQTVKDRNTAVSSFLAG